MQAMILAAGFGTRLRPYSLIKPKPLFPVLNKPLLHILLDMLLEYGFTKIVVNCHHLSKQIVESLTDYPEVIIQNEPEILGTGGSIRKAWSNFSDQPVLVMNGDIYHDIDVGKLYKQHCLSGAAVTMAVHDYQRFNSVTVSEQKVIGFSKELNGDKRAFTGIHVINPEIIDMIPEGVFFHIIDLYQRLADERKVSVYAVDGCFWRDIGTPQDYLTLHRELVTLQDPSSRWLIAGNATIGHDVLLEKWGVIGCNSVVGARSALSGVVVWDNSIIAEDEIISNTIVTGNVYTGVE